MSDEIHREHVVRHKIWNIVLRIQTSRFIFDKLIYLIWSQSLCRDGFQASVKS